MAGLEGGDDPAEDAVWTAEWRTSVLDLVWKAMQQYERCEPRSDACTVLRLRAEHPDETSEQLGQRFAEKTARRSVRMPFVRRFAALACSLPTC